MLNSLSKLSGAIPTSRRYRFQELRKDQRACVIKEYTVRLLKDNATCHDQLRVVYYESGFTALDRRTCDCTRSAPQGTVPPSTYDRPLPACEKCNVMALLLGLTVHCLAFLRTTASEERCRQFRARERRNKLYTVSSHWDSHDA